MRRQFPFLPFLLAGILLGSQAPVHAGLIITPTYDDSIKKDANFAAIDGAIRNAIAVYGNTFADPINVTIYFTKGAGGGGSSNFELYNVTYTTYRNALIADVKTANDAIAVATLPAGPNNPVPKGGQTDTTAIYLTTANIKALPTIAGTFNGIKAPDGNRYDGIATLGTANALKADPTGKSLTALAEHEINEILGLGSGLNAGPDASQGLKAGTFIQPEDLFRFSAKNTRSWDAAAKSSYFSINNGDTANLPPTYNSVVNFNQSGMGDFGDWVVNTPPQVQDWNGNDSDAPVLGINEITALDVIGYDAVPEPSSLILVAVGAAGMAFRAWRQPRAVRKLRAKGTS